MRTYPAMLLGLALAVTPFAARADDAAPTGDAPAPSADTAAPAQESGVKPASATTSSPVPAAAAETDAAPEMAVELLDDPAAAVLAKKPWSVTVSDSIGFGLQADEDTSYYYTQLGVSGSYKVLDKVMVGANAGFYYTPDPKPGNGVTFDPAGVSLSVRHMSLYKDRFTGINLSGGLVLAQSFDVAGSNYGFGLPTVGAMVNLSRKVGPVNLAYGLRFNKFTPANVMNVSQECIDERGSAEWCYGVTGGYNTSWQLTNSLSAIYSPIDKLTLSGSFGFVNGATFGPSTWEPGMGPEEVLGLNANERTGFSFSLSGLYQVTDAFAAGMSFSNGGPWRSNGQNIFNPIFDPRLAAMSVDVSYTF